MRDMLVVQRAAAVEWAGRRLELPPTSNRKKQGRVGKRLRAAEKMRLGVLRNENVRQLVRLPRFYSSCTGAEITCPRAPRTH